MSYTIYISDDCPACDRVLEYVAKHSIPHELINVSNPGKNPVKGVVIYPALFGTNSLLAYGDDIIAFLEKAA